MKRANTSIELILPPPSSLVILINAASMDFTTDTSKKLNQGIYTYVYVVSQIVCNMEIFVNLHYFLEFTDLTKFHVHSFAVTCSTIQPDLYGAREDPTPATNRYRTLCERKTEKSFTNATFVSSDSANYQI